jgi:hypothetical protein
MTELKVYPYPRELLPDELDVEVGEYFDNEKTFKSFPNLAKTPFELLAMISTAPPIVLSKKILISLENSDVGDVLTSKNPLKFAKQIAKEHNRDINRIFRGIQNKTALPMPIVIKHSNGYYLLGGNTRLCAMAGVGYTMPVKLLTYNKGK